MCNYSNGVCEVLIVKVHQLDTIVTVVYRPPDTRYHEFAPIIKKIDTVFQNLPAPAPNFTIMGDLNFPSSVITWQVIDVVILPRVAGHRVSEEQSSESTQVRQQAALLCDLASKYHLTQQVGTPTRDKEVLDLIWSSNPDLVSNVLVDTFRDITDHSVVTATTSFSMAKEVIKEEVLTVAEGSGNLT